MSRFVSAFTDHPASVGETYTQHLCSALGFSASMCRAAVCCAIHAFLPFAFQRTGSRAIDDLHQRMIRNRHRLSTSTASRESDASSSRAATA